MEERDEMVGGLAVGGVSVFAPLPGGLCPRCPGGMDLQAHSLLELSGNLGRAEGRSGPGDHEYPGLHSHRLFARHLQRHEVVAGPADRSVLFPADRTAPACPQARPDGN